MAFMATIEKSQHSRYENITGSLQNGRTSSKIKRVIMPEHAYQGGGRYGHYGGYDIALIEADQPFTTFQLACLPSPSFDDYADSKLAGYGKYFRTEKVPCHPCGYIIGQRTHCAHMY